MLRIFTKRAFRFDHPAGDPEVKSVYVRDNDFADVPDWVKDSSTFKLALQDPNELISVVKSKQDELSAELGKSTRKKRDPEAPSEDK